MAKEPHMTELKAIIEAYNKAITEAPYATMKDGPDKYLFRKDDKQKLVGSADNEPEDDEEELEEQTMDKELRDMQIAAGIRVAEDCDVDVENNDDGECSPFTHADENVDMVREDDVEEDFAREDLLLPPKDRDGDGEYDTDEDDDGHWDNSGNVSVRTSEPFDNDRVVDNDDEGTYSGETNFDDETFDDWTAKYPGESVDEDAIEGTQRVLFSGRDGLMNSRAVRNMFNNLGAQVNDDGDGIVEFSVDIEPERAEKIGAWLEKIDRSGEQYGGYIHLDNEIDEDSDDPNAMEKTYRLGEQGPGDEEDEFSYDDDAMVDLGDDDEYDFNDEVEREIGNTNRFESVVDMNELRKLAGLALIETESTDDDETAEEELEEAELSDPSKNTHVGREFSSSEFEEDKFDDNFDGLASGEIVAYEIADEKAYYAMADILGAELDFGPQDEVLVPAARNDEIVIALARQGFKQGRDFEVAGQLQDDLQNGYNDQAYTDGQDYFPKGATSQPATDLGPTAGRAGDNPMSNKMRSIEKDTVYEGMKLAYRRFRKV